MVQYTGARSVLFSPPEEINLQLWYLLGDTPMASKPVSSDLTQVSSFAARLFSFVNKERLRPWLWGAFCALLLAACIFIELQN
jgi:hypothetical protein